MEYKEKAPSSGGADSNLLVLTTEQKVYSFDLLETFRVAIGRHDTNDLKFDTRNVSNYHAEILNEADGLVLRDLGSTNGTYVNEEKVHRHRLRQGDRIRVGNYEISVRLGASNGTPSAAPSLASVGSKGRFRGMDPREGELDDGSLPKRSLKELLRAVVAADQDCVVVLSNRGLEIRAYVESGRIVHAQVGEVKAEKALFRAFSFRMGEFAIEAFPQNEQVPRTITLPVETLVEEGQQQAAEIAELFMKLPPLDLTLRLCDDSKVMIRDLSPAEFDVFQGLIRWGTLARTLEGSTLTDLRVMSATHSLMRKKVFDVEGGHGALLEETNIITNPEVLKGIPGV